MNGTFYKNKPNDLIWWRDVPDRIGVWEFSFDRKRVFNMFRDYPHELTPEQRKIFDRENPYWRDFFSDRVPGNTFDDALKAYFDKFGKNYPVMITGTVDDNEIIADIMRCIESGTEANEPTYEDGTDY